jgi:hypothetical protein
MYMLILLKFVAILIFVPFIAYAQVDSTYIAPFPQECSAGIYTYYQYTMIRHELDNNNSMVYLPNSPLGVGLSLAYKNFSIAGGWSLNFTRDPEYGPTKSLDLQYHYYAQKFIVDLYFAHYDGFYTENQPDKITLCPDIKVVQYGLYGMYVFNNKKFSYPAAFNHSKMQKKSAGSFQLGGGFCFNRISSDSSLTAGISNTLNNYRLSFGGGYVYSFIFGKNFNISAGLSVGLDIGTDNLHNMESLRVSPSLFPRVASGYNGKNWSFGVSFVLNEMYIARRDRLNTIIDTGYLEFSFTRRFNKAPKFLKKIRLLN